MPRIFKGTGRRNVSRFEKAPCTIKGLMNSPPITIKFWSTGEGFKKAKPSVRTEGFFVSLYFLIKFRSKMSFKHLDFLLGHLQMKFGNRQEKQVASAYPFAKNFCLTRLNLLILHCFYLLGLPSNAL